MFSYISTALFIFASLLVSPTTQLKPIQPPKQTMAPYTSVAFFTFSDEDTKSQFLDGLKKLISYVEKEEPDTLVYTFLQDKDNSLAMMAYEAWTDEDAFNAHCVAEPFQEFFGILGPLLEAGTVKIESKFSDKEMICGFAARK